MTEKILKLHEDDLLKLPIVCVSLPNGSKNTDYRIPFFRQYLGGDTIIYAKTAGVLESIAKFYSGKKFWEGVALEA